MKRIILTILVTLLSGVMSYSQNITVSGKITDSKGEPVIGAVVMLKNKGNVGTVTDADGKYSFSVPAAKSTQIVVSCISYKEQTINVAGRSVINVVLEDDAEQLEEVVVVGYGAMRRSDLTGSVASVKIDEEQSEKSATLDQLLEGRAAGVQVISNSGSPDSGISIQVRGISTFSGNSDPLYVVDGVIINGAAESISTITTGTESSVDDQTNGLAGINPQDIASIEILKDASATAIYGSQGANGVVLITTKQANRNIPQVRFNAGVMISQRINSIDVLGFDDYVTYLQRLGTNSAINLLSSLYTDPDNRQGLKVTPINWQDYMSQIGISRHYYLSVSGRPNGYNYMFSVGYHNNQGVLKQSNSDNFTVRLNLEKSVFKKFKIGTKTSFGYTFSHLLSGAAAGTTLSGSGSILRSMIVTRPFVYADPEDMDDDPDEEDLRFGPNRWLSESYNCSDRYRLNPSLFAEWKMFPWLTFKSTIGGEFSAQTRIKTKTSKVTSQNGNSAGIGKSTRVWYNWDNLLTARNKFGKHSITATLGQSLSRNQQMTENVQGYHLPQARAREMSLNMADVEYASFYYRESASSLLSFFARGIYNYDDRYVLTATYRFDGSSKFSGANKWSQFPSFALAWRLANEPWFNIPGVSNAKIRLGWGRVGSQAISNYETLTTYSTSSVGNNYSVSGKETTVVPNNISNPDLKWETSEQVNVGLDLSLWKGRLAFTFDAYRKDTKDLLQNKNVTISTGFSTIAMNDGAIRNSGLEFSIDAVPVKIGDFEWGLSGNISFNRNTILSVGESGDSGEIYLSPGILKKVNYFNGSSLQNSGNVSALNIFIEGESMGLFYGYLMEGIVQEGEVGPGFEEGETRGPGNIRYADLNGNGYIDENDRTIIGNPLPKFTYGFNTSLTWKNFSVKASFTGSYGKNIFNLNHVHEYDTFLTNRNVSREAAMNAWSVSNPSNVWPGLGKVSATNDGRFSSRTVEDGSFLRFGDLSFSYNLPIKKKTAFFKRVGFTASCGNVYVWTKYTGWSPRNNSYGTSVKRMGIDLSTAPVPRTYDFSVKFTF